MAPDFDEPDATNTRSAMTVSALNRAVSGLLERSFPLVRVRGEIANLTRAASGHSYFALKDRNAQVRCVMFRTRSQLMDWSPREGDEVEVSAVVSFYEARGEFQLGVEFMRRAGQGRLFEEFLRLKALLASEGLFALERKRALPRIPQRVAVITSLQAAVLSDLVTTLCRRAPYVGVVIYPVPVQGAGAGGEIAEMLKRVSGRARADGVEVALLVRGGGSIEDLWAFNDERVARAIVASVIPVVVGVGHESDITIADFAADLRAATPTAAAELVAPAASELIGEFQQGVAQLQKLQAHRVQAVAQRLDYAQRSLATPRMPLAALDGKVERLAANLRQTLARLLQQRGATLATHRDTLLRTRLARVAIEPRARVAALASNVSRMWNTASLRLASLDARLHALDPHAVLARGYSIVVGETGHVVFDATSLRAGEDLQLLFARGRATARVHAVRPSAESDPGGAAIESLNAFASARNSDNR